MATGGKVWELDVVLTKGGFLRALLAVYIVFIAFLSAVLIISERPLTIALFVSLFGLFAVFLHYMAFLEKFKERSRYHRRSSDLPFDDLVDLTVETLKEDGRPFRWERYLGEGVPSKGAKLLTRFNHFTLPQFMSFKIKGRDIRLRVYEPNHKKVRTCCIVLGPFDGEMSGYSEHVRRGLERRLVERGDV